MNHDRTAALAKILSDLDRCEHGRHRSDPCLGASNRGCIGGNPHMTPGAVIGYDLYGQPYTVPTAGRSCSDPDAWRTP